MGLILKANNINIEYSGREILNIDELELYSYDRIGLVGNNGTGKSTLFQVLSGEISSSSCPLQRFGEFAYIKQLEDIMLDKVDDYGMLSRLNVSDIQEETMSGGEETRVKIAAALSQQVHAIFADEPTCHLDQAGTELLIEQLKYFNGALIVISHDRYFLDHVVDKIWELDNGKITEYWGNYSDYTNQKKEIRKHQEIQYEHFIYEREKLESAINEKRKQASTIDNKQKGQKSKNSNENAGRLGHQKSTGSKQKKLY
uniref:ATP-binding cassette domain-containing protein n=1 Tax=Anaerosporobacter sp. TaxID=1872529 RepID=UPI00286F649C